MVYNKEREEEEEEKFIILNKELNCINVKQIYLDHDYQNINETQNNCEKIMNGLKELIFLFQYSFYSCKISFYEFKCNFIDEMNSLLF